MLKGWGRPQGAGNCTGLGCCFLTRESLGASGNGNKAKTCCKSTCAPWGDGGLGDIKYFTSLMSACKQFASQTPLALGWHSINAISHGSSSHWNFILLEQIHIFWSQHSKRWGEDFLPAQDVCDSLAAGMAGGMWLCWHQHQGCHPEAHPWCSNCTMLVSLVHFTYSKRSH